MLTALDKLRYLHNAPTRYELIAEHGDTRVMLCYSAQLGRRAINETCLRRAYNLAALIGVPADDLRITFLKPAARGAIVNDWSIRSPARKPDTFRPAYLSHLVFMQIGRVLRTH